MNDLKGFMLSSFYVAFIILMGTLIYKNSEFNKKYDGEISRKFVHIFLGNWIILAIFTIENPFLRALLPFLMIFFNYFISKYKIIDSFHRISQKGIDYSTIYYSVILTIFAFLPNYTQMPYEIIASILILAYGDGLAGIIGKIYGKPLNIRFFNGKSLIGGLTVFFTSFIIIFLIHLKRFGFVNVNFFIFIFTVSLVAMLVELISKNGYDNIFLPLSIFLMYLIFTSGIKLDLSMYFVCYLLIIFMIFVIKFELLDENGAIVAFLTGNILYFGLGIALISSLFLFFILGSLVSKFSNDYKKEAKLMETYHKSRNMYQVLCNSFPAVIVSIMAIMGVNSDLMLLAGFSVFASATSDTFASEIGMFSKEEPLSIIDLKPVKRGLSGGVTKLGFIASLVGSMLVSILVWIHFDFAKYILVVIIGFISSIIDSILGAVIQVKYVDENNEICERKTSKIISGIKYIDNNVVNIITNFIASFLGIIIFYSII